MEITIYPRDILELNTKNGFIKKYYYNVTTCGSYREAYHNTEVEHNRFYGRNRYSNYHSFRQVLNRQYNKK